MKRLIIIHVYFLLGVSCNTNRENAQGAVVEVKKDTIAVQTGTVATPGVKDTITSDAADIQIVDEEGERVGILPSDYEFLSDPYDFYLGAESITQMLGPGAKLKTEEFEGGEDYEAYSYSTVTFINSEISFYSYPGKHFSDIYTSSLPLKKGIIIGMMKDEFLKAWNIADENASKATVFRLEDEYGMMKFTFRADTLYNIHANYEQGD
jgi:hypothetical protein